MRASTARSEASTDGRSFSAPRGSNKNYAYNSGGQRILKTAGTGTAATHTLYIFDSLELRGTAWAGNENTLDPTTANVRLLAGPITARVALSAAAVPTANSRHVFLEFSDHLGSNSFTIDHATGELVEYTTYQAYGAVESAYRPGRWASFREPYKFTGKEEDVEVGLVYFGFRYLNPLLQRWISADPLAVHDPGQADLNVYAYVSGRALKAVDPDGRDIYEYASGYASGLLDKGVAAAKDFVKPVTLAAEGKFGDAAADLGGKIVASSFAVAPFIATYDLVKGLIDAPGQIKAAVTAPSDFDSGRLAVDPTLTTMKVAAIALAPKVGQKTSKPPEVEIVQRAMSDAEAKATQSTGLVRGGRPGEHHVSDAVNSNAGRAQQRLALPQKPEVRLTMEVPKGRFGPPTKVKTKYNMPGGGTERKGTGRIRARVIRKDRL